MESPKREQHRGDELSEESVIRKQRFESLTISNVHIFPTHHPEENDHEEALYLVLLLTVFACDDSTQECDIGSEGCACTKGGAYDPGLVCDGEACVLESTNNTNNINNTNNSNNINNCDTLSPPSDPTPANEAQDVLPLEVTSISWTHTGDASQFHVYFSDSCPPPSFPDASYVTVTQPSMDVILEYDTEYCWKVVAENGQGCTVDGQVWTFTTSADCVETDNGWPGGTVPVGYNNGSGWTIGARAPLFTGGLDQNGNDDVALEQFYGFVTVLRFQGLYCGPSQEAASVAAQSLTTLASLGYEAWFIDILLPMNFLTDAPTTESHAQSWAGSFGLTYPVLYGSLPLQLAMEFELNATPTFVILDPEFKVADIVEGYNGVEDLEQRIKNVSDEFMSDNPAWERSCHPAPITPGCGNGIIETGEECDIGTGALTCHDLPTPKGYGAGLVCDGACTLDDTTCGLATCSMTGSESLGFSMFASCPDVVGETRYDVFALPILTGDCVHIFVDNGVEGADLKAVVKDSAGKQYGGVLDQSELDDESPCNVAPASGGGCPDRAVVASANGELFIGVAQWGGCSGDAEYTLHVSVNGTDIDLSTVPYTDDTAGFPDGF